jgi:hypothetical protein
MATTTMTLPEEPTTLYYYLEVKDGGIIQTYPGALSSRSRSRSFKVARLMQIRNGL